MKWPLQRSPADTGHPAAERPVVRYPVVAHVGPDPDGPVLQGRDAAGGAVALRRVPDDAVEVVRSQAGRLAGLEDPHVVRVRDLAEERGGTWLVTDWVDGATLAEVVASGATLVVGQRLGVIRGLLAGLAAAHEEGVVHGRISASSVLVGSDGRTRVTGFALGSPARAYVAPEALARPRSARTTAADVYAAAALAVHLLTGRTVDQQSRELLALDTALRPPLTRALSRDSADRPRDARALLHELETAAREAYGEGWWTEAGIGALVGPATPDVVAVDPGASAEPGGSAAFAGPAAPGRPGGVEDPGATVAHRERRSRRPLRWVAAGVAGLLTVAGVVAGAVAVQELNEDVPPDPVTLRTDLFCEDFGAAAQRAVGPGATTRFGSSGSSRADPAARASVSCTWTEETSATTVAVTVGAAIDASDRMSAERLAGVLDGANQRFVAAQGASWQDAWSTRCRELERHGYDAAFACLTPAVTVPGTQVRPGTAAVRLVFSTPGQSLACGATRVVRAAADTASYDALVESVEALCAEVLPAVRRGG